MEITCASTVSTIDSTERLKHLSNIFGLIRNSIGDAARTNTRRNVSALGIPLGKAKNCSSHSYQGKRI